MSKGRLKNTQGGMRKEEVEQAAQTLRRRLSFAKGKANENSHITVQSLQADYHFNPLPLLSTVESPFAIHILPSSGSDASMQSPGVGLGLGIDSMGGSGIQSDLQKEPLASPPKASEKSQDKTNGVQEQTREPSLYDAIFGPAYAQLARKNANSSNCPTTPPNPTKNSSSTTTSTNLPPMKRSPHVRQGSSAQLEKVASSPRLSTSPIWQQNNRAQMNGGTGTSGGARLSNAFAYPIASPSKQRQKSEGGGGVGLRGGSNGGSRSSSGIYGHILFDTPLRHNRLRSSGGSLLPNGHPASTLAQDLGIASGGSPSRSRTSSSNIRFLSNNNHDDHNQAETDRMAALLSSMVAATPAPMQQHASSYTGTGMVTPPKRKRRNSNSREAVDGNEAAAHSLLDLAASPSPSPILEQRHRGRFSSTSPRMNTKALPRRLFDSLDNHNATANANAYAHAKNAASGMESHHLYSHQPASSLQSIHDLTSPPMTPPRSERRLYKKSVFNLEGSNDGSSSPPCPPTPSRRGQMVLLSDQEGILDGDEQHIAGKKGGLAHQQQQDQQQQMDLHSIKKETGISTDTPRTPPPLHAPTTPKAPGSNFCYGEFLHVSPSPQPRIRTNSCHGSNKLTPRLGSSVQDTPTKGTRSHARFDTFQGVDLSQETPLTTLEFADVLTPGRHHHHHLLNEPNNKKPKLSLD